MWARAESLWLLYDAGRWDDLLGVVATILPWAAEHGDSIAGTVALSYRSRVLAHRGSFEALQDDLERIVPIARQVGDLQVQAPAFIAAAVVEHALGDGARALDHVREFEEVTRDGPTEYRELQSPEVIRVCLANGAVELAAQVLGDRPVHVARTQHAVLTGKALLSEARGDLEDAAYLFARAAEAWGSYGDPFERAHALEGLARCLEGLGSNEAGARARREAAELLASLGVPFPG
jgi:tetratricopeptide (TPR) repeat protein